MRELRGLKGGYMDTEAQIEQYIEKKGGISEEFLRYNREAVVVKQFVTEAIKASVESLNLNEKQVGALRAIQVVGRLDSIEAAVEAGIAVFENGTELIVLTGESFSGFKISIVQLFNRYKYHFKGLPQVSINIKHTLPLSEEKDGYSFSEERDALRIMAHVRTFYDAEGQMTGHENIMNLSTSWKIRSGKQPRNIRMR